MTPLAAAGLALNVASKIGDVKSSVNEGRSRAKAEYNSNGYTQYDKILKNPKTPKIADSIDSFVEKEAMERIARYHGQMAFKGMSPLTAQLAKKYGKKILHESVIRPMISASAMIAVPFAASKLLNADIRGGFKPVRPIYGVDKYGNRYVDVPERKFKEDKGKVISKIKSKYNLPEDQRLIIKSAAEKTPWIDRPVKPFGEYVSNDLIPNTIKGIASGIPAAATIAYFENQRRKRRNHQRPGTVRIMIPNSKEPKPEQKM